MGMSDHDYVNFSEDHEMNYHLRKVGKSQSSANRETLRVMGRELKAKLNAKRITHGQFSPYVAANKHRLD